MVRCYERTRHTLEFIAKQISQKMGLKEYYAYESQAKLFIDKLDYDMTILNEFMADNSFVSVEGNFRLQDFIRDKINRISRSFEFIKTSGEYFKFLKYVSVKMIKGMEVKNRWIDYVSLTDDSNYSRNLDELLSKAIHQKLLVKHKNLVRFRLNSIFQAFIQMS